MMNAQQEKLYKNLLELTKFEPKVFYFVPVCHEEVMYRAFNYRIIPSYSAWLTNDSALECRGITFRVDDKNQPTDVVCWPFEKFFNLNENPFTMDLDLNNAKEILVKEDGSLISSLYLPSGKLHLKSKASFQSKEAKAANELMGTAPFKDLHDWTLDWTKRGYTVILEYTSPFNKIVVPYSESTLTILAIRNNLDGTYVDLFGMMDSLPTEIRTHLVKNLVDEVEDANAFVQSIHNQKGVEGYVVRLQTGQRTKIKTAWYKGIHYARGKKKLCDVALAKLVLEESIDDVRSSHVDSPEVLERIDRVTRAVSQLYNETLAATSEFYEDHKHLDRGDFAIKAKKELSGTQMGIVMQLYSGKKANVSGSLFHQIKKDGLPC